MFDLEGMPPQLDELEKIYLWGMQVFGERPGEFRAATAGFGRDGDRAGWYAFLAEADGDLRRARRHPLRPLGELRAARRSTSTSPATATATASPSA